MQGRGQKNGPEQEQLEPDGPTPKEGLSYPKRVKLYEYDSLHRG